MFGNAAALRFVCAEELILIPNLNLMNIYFFLEFAPLRNEHIMEAQFNLWGTTECRQKASFLEKPSEE